MWHRSIAIKLPNALDLDAICSCKESLTNHRASFSIRSFTAPENWGHSSSSAQSTQKGVDKKINRTRNFKELKLKKGDTVFAVVNATGNDSERLTSYCTSTIFQRRDLYPTSHSFFTRNNDPVPPR
jgi:hypothetical protein